jgi:chromosome segregation ATPase
METRTLTNSKELQAELTALESRRAELDSEADAVDQELKDARAAFLKGAASRQNLVQAQAGIAAIFDAGRELDEQISDLRARLQAAADFEARAVKIQILREVAAAGTASYEGYQRARQAALKSLAETTEAVLDAGEKLNEARADFARLRSAIERDGAGSEELGDLGSHLLGREHADRPLDFDGPAQYLQLFLLSVLPAAMKARGEKEQARHEQELRARFPKILGGK